MKLRFTYHFSNGKSYQTFERNESMDMKVTPEFWERARVKANGRERIIRVEIDCVPDEVEASHLA